jgi:acetyl/propionyl-CoA carboxylase alpha subunit
MPSPGVIVGLRVPGGPGIRDDSGIYEGFEVPIYYDSLLSKLVSWGPTRAEAIQRMSRALEEYQVLGIKTTIPFFQRVMKNEHFLGGNVTTSFIDEVFSTADSERHIHWRKLRLIAAAIAEMELEPSVPVESGSGNSGNAWRFWDARGNAVMKFVALIGGRQTK